MNVGASRRKTIDKILLLAADLGTGPEAEIAFHDAGLSTTAADDALTGMASARTVAALRALDDAALARLLDALQALEGIGNP